ncbi:MAG: VanZ family protein [Bacteroidia bacterium]|nr:VanZ family protein [Bacteroidia bacterium]
MIINQTVKQYKYTILWAVLILFACGASPGTLAELKLEDLFGYDKPIHAFLFGMQTWLGIKENLNNTSSKTKTILLKWCLMSAVFGALIELMQKFIFIGRSYDYFDMLANTLGCIIAYIIALRKYKLL